MFVNIYVEENEMGVNVDGFRKEEEDGVTVLEFLMNNDWKEARAELMNAMNE